MKRKEKTFIEKELIKINIDFITIIISSNITNVTKMLTKRFLGSSNTFLLALFPGKYMQSSYCPVRVCKPIFRHEYFAEREHFSVQELFLTACTMKFATPFSIEINNDV